MYFFKISKVLGSKLNPDTSFTILIPNFIPFSIISDFRVSNEIGIFLQIDFNVLFTLLHSTFASTPLEPGLVDSPPISIMSAPDLNILIACLAPLSLTLNLPPSEKLSGVIFNIPIIQGNFEKLKFAKFFFFEVIVFKSFIIYFFNDLGRLFNLFTENFLNDFLEINSI